MIVDTGVGMVFAHLGNGIRAGSDRFLQTTFLLFNDTNQFATGTIELYDDNGDPLELTLGDVTGTSFPFTLSSGEIKRFSTTGAGEVITGWAHVHSDQPISGTASFGIRDDSGTVFTDVGVAASALGSEFTVFADSIGNSNSGLGIANPNESGTLELELKLRDGAGGTVMMTELSLPPLGHIGRFLNELFPEVDGINEYEGSVHIRSTNQQEFAGITLRVTGNQLTSLPMVAPPPEGADWDQLAFPRVGDGLLEGLRIATSTILFNTTAETVTGAVEFFNSDGTPMDVDVVEASAARSFGGTSASRFDFSIEPKGVQRLSTAGNGEIKVGWALVSMDQPISGTALFTLFDESSEVATEVGVNSARLRRNFNLIADTTDVFNTAIAITNPVKSEDEGDEPTATVRIELRDGSRRLVGRTEVEVGPLEHTALFLTELFPEVEGVDELQGLMWVSSSEFVTVLSLRSADEKLTSVPVFTPKNGFAPNSTLEFAQNLAGTAPPVRLLLHQNSRDLALRRVVISAPQLGLDMAAVEPGSPIMFGYLADSANSRIFRFLTRDAEQENKIELDLVISRSTGTFIQASGSMEGSPTGGWVLDLLFPDKLPNTYVGAARDLNFFLAPDLITLSDSPQSFEITTEFHFCVHNNPATESDSSAHGAGSRDRRCRSGESQSGERFTGVSAVRKPPGSSRK